MEVGGYVVLRRREEVGSSMIRGTTPEGTPILDHSMVNVNNDKMNKSKGVTVTGLSPM